MKIGFKFNNSHVWSIEELQELQNIVNEYNWNNFEVGNIIYTSTASEIVFYDFRLVRKDENVIILQER